MMKIENEIFEIRPYQGVGKIVFEMKPAEIEKLFGKPELSMNDFIGRTEERRGGLSVKYNSEGGVNEVSFLEGMKVYYEGMNLFENDNALKILSKEDKPVNIVGFKVFFSLGVAITGYSKKKDSRTISVFSKELEPMWKMLKNQ